MAGLEDIAEQLRERFLDFLEHFQADGGASDDAPKPYLEQVDAMPRRHLTTLTVDFEHMNAFDAELASLIQEHHYRLTPVLKKTVQALVKKRLPDYSCDEQGADIEFWVGFTNLPLVERLRGLTAEKLGRLMAFTGTVTRTTEVGAELYLATFKCGECGQLAKDVEQQFKFTQPLICSSEACGNRRNWQLVKESSVFVDWQRAKVQECSEEVPAGSLPRTTEVILRNDLVESARAGDKVTFVGNIIVVPDVTALSTPGEKVEAAGGGRNGTAGGAGEGVGGLKLLGKRELTYKLAFLASSTMPAEASAGMVSVRADQEQSADELWDSLAAAEQEELRTMRANPRLYDDMARSLAPGVCGHLDVKRAVLLMLLGGVHKETTEGIGLRGDINVAIIGDPSCAKSQVLKYVARFLPRAVYTSGKSSSAAGLTASVVKESDSNEFCIEAGALMLADNGICCIDEFDKMDQKDQVAIHEAMEQQTISIAKAGIQATLNARTSILAAANPAGGRYDKSKPLRYNVMLPPAILSRFDLLHIMVDEPDEAADRRIARHIVSVHQRRDGAFAGSVPYAMGQLQRYVRMARALRPQLSPEAKAALVAGYTRLRGDDAAPGSATSYRITVRQLEALVRLSEALARLRFSLTVSAQHVAEAVRLVKNSILAVEAPAAEVEDLECADDLASVEAVVARFRARRAAAGGGGGAAGGSDARDADGGAAAEPMDADEGASAPGPGGEEAARLAGLRREAEAGVAALQRRRQATKVSQRKVDAVKTFLVTQLRQLEAEGGGGDATLNSVPVATMTQHELLTLYFDDLAQRQELASAEEVQEEVVLLSKIVQHLVRKEAVLVVVEVPARQPGEDDATYARRQQRERSLAVNPNYAE